MSFELCPTRPEDEGREGGNSKLKTQNSQLVSWAGGCLLARSGLHRNELEARSPFSCALGFAAQHEAGRAAAGTAAVRGALVGMDRYYPHPIARIGEPTVATEGFEVVHLYCFT